MTCCKKKFEKLSAPEIIGHSVERLRGNRTLTEVSRGTGIQHHYLRRIERGKANPSAKMVQRLADFFGVEVIALLGFDPSPVPIIEHKIYLSPQAIAGKAVEDFIPIPLLKDPLSLSPDLTISKNTVSGTCIVERSQLTPGGVYQAFHVQDDSMLSVVRGGDIVVIDVADRQPSELDGKLIVCKVAKKTVAVRRFFIRENKYYLQADKAWEDANLPLITAAKPDLILGKLVWAWKAF